MLNRRTFIRQSSCIAVGFLGLQRLSLLGDGLSKQSQLAAWKNLTCSGYGPLIPDPNRIFDLPNGFEYRVIAQAGDLLDDGFLCPGDPDGMAAFPLEDGRVALICNHELSSGETQKSPYGPENAKLAARNPETIYDAGFRKTPQLGGTSTLIFNPKTGQKERHYLSLTGTDRNCAGGPTPWNSWITCEESDLKADNSSVEKDHGYNFEVPASADILHVKPVALKAMGRFRHEAVAVEPISGIVYQTEDMGDGLIYRFIPNVPGQLAKGGRLQALMIQDSPSRDTRNWPETNQPAFARDQKFAVQWIDLDDVESPENDLRFRGFKAGAARFARGEGMWYSEGEVFFACTNGGSIKKGQVFRYTPSPYEGTAREAESPGQLELFVESGNAEILKNCDNLTVAPNGHLYLCEDAERPCKLVGVTPEGKLFEFGRNAYTGSELAGVCFSPDGQTLFINLQGNGQTLAITGPWDQFSEG